MVKEIPGIWNWFRKPWTKGEILSRSVMGTAGWPESLYLNDFVGLLFEWLERKEIAVVAWST